MHLEQLTESLFKKLIKDTPVNIEKHYTINKTDLDDTIKKLNNNMKQAFRQYDSKYSKNDLLSSSDVKNNKVSKKIFLTNLTQEIETELEKGRRFENGKKVYPFYNNAMTIITIEGNKVYFTFRFIVK